MRWRTPPADAAETRRETSPARACVSRRCRAPRSLAPRICPQRAAPHWPPPRAHEPRSPDERRPSAAIPLEPELLEEPLVLVGLEGGLVLVLEDLLDLLARVWPRLGPGDGLLVDDVLEVHLQGVPRGHDVVVVDHLHEGPDARPLGHLLLGHLLDNLERVLVNPGHNAVAVGPVVGAVVLGLHDHSLPAREAPVQQDHHFAVLEEFGLLLLLLLLSGSLFLLRGHPAWAEGRV
mmetsp:Transcript_12137/g.41227  ORF Transcript_12137/g.41227 Transcript_12137/m.41227 type:complete len:234 (+) Transcript_12137:266-967(+)